RPLVDAEVNGDPVRLIVDTGAETTLLTSAAAERLGVPATGTSLRLVGVGGEGAGSATTVHSLAIGELVLRNLPVVVDSDSENSGPSLGKVADGILGLDVLSHFDVDLDMPNGRITFYRARMCEGGRPDWTLAYATLDAEVSARLHLIVPVGLDNQTLSPIRVHRFTALTIGDLLFLRPEIPVSPLPDFVGDMLLGSDVLREHRA